MLFGPDLATLLQRHEGLDLTWEYYTKQKHLGDNNNRFLKDISTLGKLCPKLNFIPGLVEQLGVSSSLSMLC